MTNAATGSLLQVKFSAGYGRQTVLQDVEFSMDAGDRLALAGASGAGKSTLTAALFGLLPWNAGWATGRVLLEGQDLLQLHEREARRVRGRRIALVPQSPTTALNPAVTLRRHFEAAWRAHEPHGEQRRFETRVAHLLERVRLPATREFLARKPTAISVGQAQRITVALALLHRPALLVADEPTSALDPVTQADLLELLDDTNRHDGTAILLISHDLLSVIRFCQRLAVLHNGRIAQCATLKELAGGQLHPATAQLLRLLPVPLATLLSDESRTEILRETYTSVERITTPV